MIAPPDTARAEWPCPVARLWGDEKVNPRCRGEACPVWRWQPLLAKDPGFVEAIRRAMRGEFNNGKPWTHPVAVKWVMENREALGLPTAPTHGRCGLGGEVLA